MALPTLPGWDTAAHIFALVTGEWAKADLTCVVAEGISSRQEVSIVLDQLPSAAVVVTVAMITPFDTGLVRAQADLTRKMSRDPAWLSDRYDEWKLEMSRINAEVLLDASALSVQESVALLTEAVASARSMPT